MIFAVVNNSGNVGKSFIAREVLYSHLPTEENNIIVEVETHNSSSSGYAGVETAKYKANQFKEIYSALNIYDNAVLDIGASNIDNFLKELLKREEVKEEIDYYIVPAYADTKQTKDTLKTLQILQTLGIEAEKIKIVFNRVQESLKDDFSTFLSNVKKLNLEVEESLRVWDFEVVEDLDKMKTTSRDLTIDETDYKAQAKALAKEGKEVESRKASDKHLAKLMAKKLNENCRQVYFSIIK